MSADALQKIFKTLGDPTRVRILRLLEHEELAVQELMEVLGMAQSRVSRHLGILREAGLLKDRRDGTYVLYAFACPEEGPWREAWDLSLRTLADDPASERDRAALHRVIEARVHRSRNFFDAVGPEWDSLRKVWGDDLLRARAIGRLVPRDFTVVDVGTGTGTLALELAEAGVSVIAVDHSQTMIDATRAKLAGAGAERVELRQGEASALPLADAEADAALAHLVLQYLSEPAQAITEMARVVKPGGRVILVDFVAHDRAWMRAELGVVSMGFEPEAICNWLEAAGLREVHVDVQSVGARGADLPDTFIASGSRPAAAGASS